MEVPYCIKVCEGDVRRCVVDNTITGRGNNIITHLSGNINYTSSESGDYKRISFVIILTSIKY